MDENSSDRNEDVNDSNGENQFKSYQEEHIDDIDESADVPAAQGYSQGSNSTEEINPPTNRNIIENFLHEKRCTCIRCTYTRPNPLYKIPNEFECHATNESGGHCKMKFQTNKLLLLHQLNIHNTIFPISKKKKLILKNQIQFLNPLPPPTVYIYLQYENPILQPNFHFNIQNEINRVNKKYDRKPEKKKKRKKNQFKLNGRNYIEPKSILYELFADACSRWFTMEEYEQKAQHQEAMEYYYQCKEHPVPTLASPYPFVGYGRNWLKN